MNKIARLGRTATAPVMHESRTRINVKYVTGIISQLAWRHRAMQACDSVLQTESITIKNGKRKSARALFSRRKHNVDPTVSWRQVAPWHLQFFAFATESRHLKYASTALLLALSARGQQNTQPFSAQVAEWRDVTSQALIDVNSIVSERNYGIHVLTSIIAQLLTSRPVSGLSHVVHYPVPTLACF